MRAYSHIYLSSHYDDAALSCGGTIHRHSHAGEPVLVITIFAAPAQPGAPLSSLASELHVRMGGAGDLVRVRAAEDRAAMAVLGADCLHLTFMDCIYRGPSEQESYYYDDVGAVFGDVHPADSSLAQDIVESIIPHLPGTRDMTIHAPLAVGHHVDHQITNRVGWALSRQGWAVLFYEDFPYSEPGYSRSGAGPAVDPVSQALAEQPETLSPYDSEISNEDLDARIRSIQAYGSQLALVFGDPITIAERVTAQALCYRGDIPLERSWARSRPAGYSGS